MIRDPVLRAIFEGMARAPRTHRLSAEERALCDQAMADVRAGRVVSDWDVRAEILGRARGELVELLEARRADLARVA